MTSVVQRNFAAGEISPTLYYRPDLVSNQNGLRKLRNQYVRRFGGTANRNGTQFHGEVKYSDRKTRLIEFEYSDLDTAVIEMGHEYFRFFVNGAAVTLPQDELVSVTEASPGVFDYLGHGLTPGREVVIDLEFTGGLIQGQYKVSSVPDPNTFILEDINGVLLDTSSVGSYVVGYFAPVLEIVTPYQEEDLFEINFVQSQNIITFTHRDYPIYDLDKLSPTDSYSWLFRENYLQGNFRRVTISTITGGTPGTYTYEYMAVSVDFQGRESLPSFYRITGCAKIVPATPATHLTLNMNDNPNWKFIKIYKREVPYTPVVPAPPGYVPESYAGFGLLDLITAVPLSNSYKDAGEIATDESEVPKRPSVIYGDTLGYDYDGTNGGTFDLTNQYPHAVAISKQRKFYAASNNDPETFWGSKVASYNEFYKAEAGWTESTDPVKFSNIGNKIGRIKHLLDLKRLFIFTDTSEIVAQGSSDSGAISAVGLPNPERISGHGISDLAPLICDQSILFVQSRGSQVRDLTGQITLDTYQGNELSVFSAHLVDGKKIIDWAFQKTPHSIIWMIRDDGIMLSLTYGPTQAIAGWARHDFDGGKAKSICNVVENNKDKTYVIVERQIGSTTKQYIESFDSEEVPLLEDMKLMDSHLTYDGRNTSDTTVRLLTGTTWDESEPLTIQANIGVFAASMIGQQIHLYIGSGEEKRTLELTITGFTSDQIVTAVCDINVPVEFQTFQDTTWARAVQTVSGLAHLEGKDVTVFADGEVDSSPYDPDYATRTVSDGAVSLSRHFAVIHVGLPYVMDWESLNVDLASRFETMADKTMTVNYAGLIVERSGKCFMGAEEPKSTTNLLQDLKLAEVTEDGEFYIQEPILATGLIEAHIHGVPKIGGRMFIRQVNPLPLKILSMLPNIVTP